MKMMKAAFTNLERCLLYDNTAALPSKDPYVIDNENLKTTSKAFDLHRDAEWAFEGEKLLRFPDQTESLRTLLVSWNMYGHSSSEGLELLLNTKKVDHHLIVISAQECVRSIKKSVFKECKMKWVRLLRSYLDPKYHFVQHSTMNALHIIIFALKEVKDHITNIRCADEGATGFATMIGNKGGIGISFNIKDTSFLFINAHLASGREKAQKRTEDFKKVTKGVLDELTKRKAFTPRQNVLDCFDFVFFMGDLNYRLNLGMYEAISLFKSGDFQTLLSKDQLLNELKHGHSPYFGFHEGRIRFAPTYKYEKYCQNFNSEKLRAPAWCDRILFSHKSNKGYIKQASYDSIRRVFGSDHRPVFSQFVISLTKPDESCERSTANPYVEEIKMTRTKLGFEQCCWWKTSDDKIDEGSFDTDFP